MNICIFNQIDQIHKRKPYLQRWTSGAQAPNTKIFSFDEKQKWNTNENSRTWKMQKPKWTNEKKAKFSSFEEEEDVPIEK